MKRGSGAGSKSATEAQSLKYKVQCWTEALYPTMQDTSIFQALLDRTMRYQTLEDSVKEVSLWAMNDYSNLRSLWLNFIRKHPNIPDEVMKALAQDKKWLVRKEVAQRKQDLPEELLEVLAQDEHWWVRLEVAERKQELSHEVLKVLAEDKEKIVRRAVEARKG